MINQTNTLFVFVASVLVFFMTPGLAFFYGGMVSKKNAVNTMISVFMITGVAIVLFIAFGYNLAFGKDVGGIFGLSKSVFLNGFDLKTLYSKDSGITILTYLMFQMMFSIITPALFVGAVVARMKFKFLLAFVAIKAWASGTSACIINCWISLSCANWRSISWYSWRFSRGNLLRKILPMFSI